MFQPVRHWANVKKKRNKENVNICRVFCCTLNVFFAVKWRCSLVLLMHVINYTGISSITQTCFLNRISWSGRPISHAVRQEIKLVEETKSETRDAVFLWSKELACMTFHVILFENWDDYLELLVWIKLHCILSSLGFISASSKNVWSEVSES